MKFLPGIFLLLFSANATWGQTFFPFPDPVSAQELAFEQANECYIYFDNPSGDTLQLRWRSLEISMPEDWIADLCDYGLCYVGIPPNGTMNPVYDSIQPYLKLIVQPGTTPGSAWMWFRVFEKNNESNSVDVFFSLFTTGTTGTGEPVEASLVVFPNPASDFLIIENKGITENTARLFNAAGSVVWKKNLLPSDRTRADLSACPAGMYFLHHAGATHKILIQK